MPGHFLNSACPGPGTCALQREGDFNSTEKKKEREKEGEILVKFLMVLSHTHTYKHASGKNTVYCITYTIKLLVEQPCILPYGAARLS